MYIAARDNPTTEQARFEDRVVFSPRGGDPSFRYQREIGALCELFVSFKADAKLHISLERFPHPMFPGEEFIVVYDGQTPSHILIQDKRENQVIRVGFENIHLLNQEDQSAFQQAIASFKDQPQFREIDNPFAGVETHDLPGGCFAAGPYFARADKKLSSEPTSVTVYGDVPTEIQELGVLYKNFCKEWDDMPNLKIIARPDGDPYWGEGKYPIVVKYQGGSTTILKIHIAHPNGHTYTLEFDFFSQSCVGAPFDFFPPAGSGKVLSACGSPMSTRHNTERVVDHVGYPVDAVGERLRKIIDPTYASSAHPTNL